MQSIRRNTVTLLLGGVRSGKSHYAQQLGERAARVVFVATARAGDDAEMQRKVERHQRSRPPHWQTIEEPLRLAETIARFGPNCDLMIIDCLTFFAANLLDAQGDEQSPIEALCAALKSPPCSIVLVSNEVGSGVVPAYPSGRRFRDLLGEMNQSVARVAANVFCWLPGFRWSSKASWKRVLLLRLVPAQRFLNDRPSHWGHRQRCGQDHGRPGHHCLLAQTRLRGPALQGRT